MKMNNTAVKAGKQSVGMEGENDASFKEMDILTMLPENSVSAQYRRCCFPIFWKYPAAAIGQAANLPSP